MVINHRRKQIFYLVNNVNIYFFFSVIFMISCTQAKIEDSNKKTVNNNETNKICCEDISNRVNIINSQIKKEVLFTDSLKIQDYSTGNLDSMAIIKAGVFLMGASSKNEALPREFPVHKVKVNSFLMDIHEVTNTQFNEFVESTGYLTTAEKKINWEVLKTQLPPNTPKPNDEILEAGSLVFHKPNKIDNLFDFSQWWRWIKGANWKQPNGPGSTIIGIENHPVVHVSYEDALEYAKWCNKRLPTEAEWEWAARGGLNNNIYPWGNENVNKGEAKCNFWSGTFPLENTKTDGYVLTSPVMKYPPNKYGLYDMAGNVWEICSDWYDVNYYNFLSEKDISLNPQGPTTWNYPREPFDPKKVMRGGSFLCNDSYCSSYRVSARMPYSKDTGMSHTGFRCVKDI